MVLVGSVVLPHGTMIFDGDPNSSNEACRQRNGALDDGMKTSCSNLYKACSSAGKEVSRMSPDLVILHTPHGISLSKSVGVFVNPTAKGTAEWNDCWDDIKLELPMDKALANQLLTHLGDSGIDAQGICCFTNYDAPLRWGEVVPLWFIQKNLRNPAKYLIIRGDVGPSYSRTVAEACQRAPPQGLVVRYRRLLGASRDAVLAG